MKTKFINFNNKIQLVLWNHEFRGQFSDGRWENSSAHDWKAWTGLDSYVNPNNLGTDIPSWKLHYNLEDLELLKVVGYRMLGLAKIVDAFPSMEITYAVEHMVERFIMTDFGDSNKDYRKVQVQSVDSLIEDIERIQSDSYKATVKGYLAEIEENQKISIHAFYDVLRSDDFTITMMMREIKEMKKICLTQTKGEI